MENTTPDVMKNSITSTPFPLEKRKSLFNPPDISPITRASLGKRKESGTTIVSKIPVKLSTRRMLANTLRPEQTKKPIQGKPVLMTITNNEHSGKAKASEVRGQELNEEKLGTGIQEIKSPITTNAASLSSIKRGRKSIMPASSNASVKGNNSKITELEGIEILSVETLALKQDHKSNLDIVSSDDEFVSSNVIIEPNVSKSKKNTSTKKSSKTADSKGTDAKQTRTNRARKKPIEVDDDRMTEDVPEETKIYKGKNIDVDGGAANGNSSREIKLDTMTAQNKETTVTNDNDVNGGAANGTSVKDAKRVSKKIQNKVPKKPTTRKRKVIDDEESPALDPIIEDQVETGKDVKDTNVLKASDNTSKNEAPNDPSIEDSRRVSKNVQNKVAKKPTSRKRKITKDEEDSPALDPIETQKDVKAQTRANTRPRRMKATEAVKDLIDKPIVDERNLDGGDGDFVEAQTKPSARVKRMKANKTDSISETSSKELGSGTTDIVGNNMQVEKTASIRPRRMKTNQSVKEHTDEPKAEESDARAIAVEDGKEINAEIHKGKKKPCPVVVTVSETGREYKSPVKRKPDPGTSSSSIVKECYDEKEAPDSSKSEDKEPIADKVPEIKINAEIHKGKKKPCPVVVTVSETDSVSSTNRKMMEKEKEKESVVTKLEVIAEYETVVPNESISKKIDTKSSSINCGALKDLPASRIFGHSASLVDEISTSVKLVKCLKPSENVMAGIISIPPNFSHSGFSTNYNIYCSTARTSLKVTISGLQKIIENRTPFLVPKDCRFAIENVGSQTAILTFTKMRSI